MEERERNSPTYQSRKGKKKAKDLKEKGREERQESQIQPLNISCLPAQNNGARTEERERERKRSLSVSLFRSSAARPSPLPLLVRQLVRGPPSFLSAQVDVVHGSRGKLRWGGG